MILMRVRNQKATIYNIDRAIEEIFEFDLVKFSILG